MIGLPDFRTTVLRQFRLSVYRVIMAKSIIEFLPRPSQSNYLAPHITASIHRGHRRRMLFAIFDQCLNIDYRGYDTVA